MESSVAVMAAAAGVVIAFNMQHEDEGLVPRCLGEVCCISAKLSRPLIVTLL